MSRLTDSIKKSVGVYHRCCKFLHWNRSINVTVKNNYQTIRQHMRKSATQDDIGTGTGHNHGTQILS